MQVFKKLNKILAYLTGSVVAIETNVNYPQPTNGWLSNTPIWSLNGKLGTGLGAVWGGNLGRNKIL